MGRSESNLGRPRARAGAVGGGVARGITERKRTGEAISASENLTANILHTALDAIVIIDQRGNITEFNRSAERIFGYRRDEVMGRPVSEFMVPERLRQRHVDGMQRYLTGGKGRILDKRIEMPAMRADGSEFPAELIVARLPGTGPPAFIGFVRDISERKRAEHLLALECSVTRQFAETADATEAMQRAIRAICESEHWVCGRYLWVDDEAGVLRFGASWSVPNAGVERYLEEMRGAVYPPGAGLVGKVWQSKQPLWAADITNDPRVLHPEFARATGMAAALAVPVSTEGKAVGVLILHSQHVREPDEQLLQTIRVVGGQIGQFMQLLQAEQALAQSEQRYQMLFETSPAPTYVFDRETLRILAANGRMTQQYGWSREELARMSILDLRPPAERAQAEVAARGAITAVYEKRLWRHWRRDGEIIEVEVTAFELQYDGRPARLIAAIDVSARERGERSLREAAEDLRSLSNRLVSVQEDERGALARELHDRVGQNLTALAINLEILRQGVGRAAAGEFERRLRESAELTEATGKLIDNVTVELRPPMLDEHGLGAALRWYGEQQAARTGLRIDVRAPQGGGPAPRAGRDLALFRIAQEAMNNVLKHAHASRVEITLTENPQGLELSVRDDGRGLDPESEARDIVRFGRRGMRERALAVGAQFEIVPAPGGGTIVRVRAAR